MRFIKYPLYFKRKCHCHPECDNLDHRLHLAQLLTIVHPTGIKVEIRYLYVNLALIQPMNYTLKNYLNNLLLGNMSIDDNDDLIPVITTDPDEEMLPEDMPELNRAMKQSAQSQSTVNWEGRIRLPDGDVKWVNLRSSPRVLASGVLIGDVKSGSLTVAAGSRMRGQADFGWDEPAKGGKGKDNGTEPGAAA